MKGLKPSENSEKPAGTGASSCHGVPERMMKAIIEACREFLELPEEEKRGISGKHVLDPIRFGTSFNESVDEILCWRDYVKIFQHPEFHSPNKPPSFSIFLFDHASGFRGAIGWNLSNSVRVSGNPQP
ncbi:hypothetical protein V6Z11_A13G055700 [Gossypium hirsutum]